MPGTRAAALVAAPLADSLDVTLPLLCTPLCPQTYCSQTRTVGGPAKRTYVSLNQCQNIAYGQVGADTPRIEQPDAPLPSQRAAVVQRSGSALWCGSRSAW